jgi:hypothetical protein
MEIAYEFLKEAAHLKRGMDSSIEAETWKK